MRLDTVRGATPPIKRCEPPDQTEASFFGLPVDGRIHIVEIYRVAFDQERHRVRLTSTVYRADRNRFIINVGDVPISESLLPPARGSS
jgi:hypothetical protein